jgi:hypothetical protein
LSDKKDYQRRLPKNWNGGRITQKQYEYIMQHFTDDDDNVADEYRKI